MTHDKVNASSANTEPSISKLYYTFPILIYLIPVLLVTVLFISQFRFFDPATESYFFITNSADVLYFSLIWLGMVSLPLIVTVGVFVVYRSTYRLRFAGHDSDIDDSENEWKAVVSKALEWKRFILPLTFFNMFVTVIPLFLLGLDIGSYFSYEVTPQGFVGASLLPLFDVAVSTTVFYFGYLGFIIHFLELTRRRYVSRNLVPHFYMTSAFRFLYVTITIPVFVIFFNSTTSPLTDPNAVQDNPYLLILSFVIGMFPLQLLAPVIERIRIRFGMVSYDQLSITIIQGIDNTIESLLQEENIDSMQVLAMTDAHDIHRRTAIPEDVILEWQKQANLYHALGTEELIRRFARIGINDFDDLYILAKYAKLPQVESSRFMDNFKKSMQVHDDMEAMNQEVFWDVLTQVLIREYETVYGEVSQPEIRHLNPIEQPEVIHLDTIESNEVKHLDVVESPEAISVNPIESREVIHLDTTEPTDVG